MTFTSPTFLIFASVFFLIWPFCASRCRVRWLLLSVASFIFYSWWDWRFLFLMLGTGLIDYSVSLGMIRHPNHKRLLLSISICSNIGTLILFKYSAFFSELINGFLMKTSTDIRIPSIDLALPLGISFYTFQALAYTIDVYRGELKPAKNVLHFFSFLALFPQLVAGPIVRGRELLPQLEYWTPPSEESRWSGLWLITIGAFKKMVIADNLAIAVDRAFLFEGTGGPIYWWIILIMFGTQIFCDFSGYCDIARGLGRWIGYEFPINFDKPYTSTSLREFWRRWHITLSGWFKDYIYIPLGGSRNGGIQTHVNLWVTMLLCGFWHGANSTFLIWGAIHAFFMTIERLTDWPRRLLSYPLGKIISWAITTGIVIVAWTFFRADSPQQAMAIVEKLFFSAPNPFEGLGIIPTLPWAVLGIAILFLKTNLYRIPRLENRIWRRLEWASLCLILLSVLLFRGPGKTFIYFQF